MNNAPIYIRQTVTELRNELRNRGLKVSGRKLELVRRLRYNDAIILDPSIFLLSVEIYLDNINGCFRSYPIIVNPNTTFAQLKRLVNIQHPVSCPANRQRIFVRKNTYDIPIRDDDTMERYDIDINSIVRVYVMNNIGRHSARVLCKIYDNDLACLLEINVNIFEITIGDIKQMISEKCPDINYTLINHSREPLNDNAATLADLGLISSITIMQIIAH